MGSETVLTIGMLGTFFTVIFGTWRISRYIGGLETRIDKNNEDINSLGNAMRRKDKNLLRHINNHCFYINDIEAFLQKTSNYQPHTKISLTNDDL